MAEFRDRAFHERVPLDLGHLVGYGDDEISCIAAGLIHGWTIANHKPEGATRKTAWWFDAQNPVMHRDWFQPTNDDGRGTLQIRDLIARLEDRRLHLQFARHLAAVSMRGVDLASFSVRGGAYIALSEEQLWRVASASNRARTIACILAVTGA